MQPTYLPDATAQLGAFIAHHRVDAAVVTDSDPSAEYWGTLFSKFSSAAYRAGGVTIYRLGGSALKAYRQTVASQMREQARSNAIDSLILAAGQWLSNNHSFVQFDPAKALQSGALKDSWCAGTKIDPVTGEKNQVMDSAHHWFCGIEIGGGANGNVIVGVPGSYSDLEPVIARYRTAATHIYFPYPRDLLSPRASTPTNNQRAFLEMEFDPSRVAAIAAQIRASPPP